MSANGDAVHSGPLPPRLPSPPFRRVLLWFRRDLRVSDNPALIAAVQTATTVIPVYIWAPEEEGQFQPGRCSRWWLHQSLKSLDKDLKVLGTNMVYRRAPESRTALVQLVQETGAQALFFNHLYDPISLVRDNEVKAAMLALNVHCQSFNSDVLYEPWEVLAEGGRPFTNFAAFWSRAMKMPYPPPIPLPVPASISPMPEDIVGLDLDSLGLMSPEEQQSNQQLYHSWTPGGKGAHARLEQFVNDRLKDFSEHRAKTDRESTSMISPHIHFGEISNRHIYYVVKRQETKLGMKEGEWQESALYFLRQIAFREYARYLSFHFPFTHERSLLEHLRAAPWKFDQRLFKAWRQGRTGYPLVDAGMRQLWSTGWMHNRIRVVCSSFLVKNLLLPWQWGLKHYWDALLDADLESAALGWQYVSGCLADAHPFSYMLDHKRESKRFDPDGNYVRRWLPVLARMPVKYIHRPWEAPENLLSDAGVELGVNYPYPVVSVEESESALAHAAAIIQQSVVNQSDEIPYRPATTPSALRSLRGTPTPSTVTPMKRQRDKAARDTAKAFDAAAARASQPDHRAYESAERKAGLAGEAAQVPKASMAGRIAGERRTPDTSSREVSNDAADSGAAAGPGARRGRHVRGPALSAQANSALSMPDEEVVSNNISALCIRGDAGAAGTSAAADPNSADQPRNGQDGSGAVGHLADEAAGAAAGASERRPAGRGDAGTPDAEIPSVEAVVPSMSADAARNVAVVPGDIGQNGPSNKRRHL